MEETCTFNAQSKILIPAKVAWSDVEPVSS